MRWDSVGTGTTAIIRPPRPPSTTPASTDTAPRRTRTPAETGIPAQLRACTAAQEPRATAPTGCTVARQVADLEAVRKKIGAEKVVLMGATLAAEYLAEHPGHVERMVPTSPGVLWAPAWKDRDEGASGTG
ncbi:hypothetical protein PV682_14035 [Streptomyces niveiscabiei]|uniref:alpha/beta fold hydrolase n=1 Tax=Streptomyces niveiscabiei TaxID=164115 RepID=UPI0029A53221|nr:hypothetical protein [Streptomyces niveiscabiei]MDX3382576.1 hypothetical protein [Streptomyces niveiscabiei]